MKVRFYGGGPYVGCTVISDIEEVPDDTSEEDLREMAETFFWNEGFEYYHKVVKEGEDE